jgi:DNA-binding ferritin-like protein
MDQAGGKTRRTKSSGGDVVSHLLTIRNQVKLYHWQTKSFARHKATDDLTDDLDKRIDEFVEVYMGRYGRPTVRGSIKLHNFSESAAKAFVVKQTKYLSSELPRKIGKNDTDLLNIRDEILGDLNKVLYLFTLA